MKSLVLGILCLPFIYACEEDFACICTTEFVSIRLMVVDQAGDTVPEVTLTIMIQRTGEILDVYQDPSPGLPLRYTVFDDSFKSNIRHSGDIIQVDGEKDGNSFTVLFEVDVPGPCACHIRKVSGPEVATLM